MKICYDNLEGVKLTKNGYFIKGTNTYILKDSCSNCNQPFLTNKHNPSVFCSKSCGIVNNPLFNKGKKLSSSHKKALSIAQLKRFNNKENHPRWKGGIYSLKKVPLYDTYKDQLIGSDLSYKVVNDLKLLQVRCVYCGKYFIPSLSNVRNRIVCLNQSTKSRTYGEGRFYCSDNCKSACPVFNQRKYPKGFKKATSREVQPELRQLVLKRDNYTCQYGGCGKTVEDSELHCHHIEGINLNPIESADLDLCITLCKEHHKLVHKEKGCKYHELKCKENL